MNSHKEIVLDGELSLNIPMDGEVGTVTKVVEHDPTPPDPTGYETIYDGNYDVTPSASAQTILHTKNKRLTDNVVVKKIPYFETTNAGGGSTVYIAGNVEFG